MSITTDPIFFYINPVTNNNFQLNILEPSAANIELTASLLVGSYTMDQLDNEISRALNDVGQNEYTVTLDRSTRKYTISADGDFDLLVSSGTNVANSVFSLIGFTGADRTGGASYESDSAAGSSYEPQFPLQGYIDFNNSKEGVDTKVNESASGVPEVVSFGSKRIMSMNIKYITNNTGDRKAFTCTPDSFDFVQDALNFMEFITDKNNLEFMKDKTDLNTFDNILLESTAKSSNGSGYELKELYSQNLTGYYETGRLRFRKL